MVGWLEVGDEMAYLCAVTHLVRFFFPDDFADCSILMLRRESRSRRDVCCDGPEERVAMVIVKSLGGGALLLRSDVYSRFVCFEGKKVLKLFGIVGICPRGTRNLTNVIFSADMESHRYRHAFFPPYILP